MAAVASVVCSVTSVWVVDFLKQLIEAVSEKRVKEVLLEIIIKAVIVIVLGMLAKYCVVKMMGLFQAGVLRDMRRDTLNHIMKVSPDFMENNNFGDIMERLSSDISDIALYMQTYLMDCIYVPIVVIVFTIYLFSLNMLLAAACLIPLAIVVPLTIILLKPVKLAQADYVKRLGYTNNNIQEAFDGVSVIKSYNLQKNMSRKYYRDLKKTLDISNANDLRQYNIEPLSRLIREAPIVIALCAGGALTLNGHATIGVLVAFISGIGRINEPLVSAYQLVVKTQMALISVKRVLEILELPIEDNKSKRTDLPIRCDVALELVNVGYRYKNRLSTDDITLENMSFKVGQKEKIALIGRSGCGKSTIIKLLSRQYEIDKGEIYIYGNKYSELAPERVRDEISLISQDTIIFPISVLDNIAIGRVDASKVEIISASIKAGCDEFVQNMPSGYDTILDEKGGNLSGGQRQRISIARAILKDSPIMLLDEPTSALDKETERYIIETLKDITKDKTIITVTHRIETIMDYDKVLVIKDGKIMEEGPLIDLIESTGEFQDIPYDGLGGDNS